MLLRISMMLLGIVCALVLKADKTTTAAVNAAKSEEHNTEPMHSALIVVWACNGIECETCVTKIDAILHSDNDPTAPYWPPCVKVALMQGNMTGTVVGKLGKKQVFETSLTRESAVEVRDCYSPPESVFPKNSEICLRIYEISFTDEFAQTCVDILSGIKYDEHPYMHIPLGCVKAEKTGKLQAFVTET